MARLMMVSSRCLSCVKREYFRVVVREGQRVPIHEEHPQMEAPHLSQGPENDTRMNPIATGMWAQAHSCRAEYATCCRRISPVPLWGEAHTSKRRIATSSLLWIRPAVRAPSPSSSHPLSCLRPASHRSFSVTNTVWHQQDTRWPLMLGGEGVQSVEHCLWTASQITGPRLSGFKVGPASGFYLFAKSLFCFVFLTI